MRTFFSCSVAALLLAACVLSGCDSSPQPNSASTTTESSSSDHGAVDQATISEALAQLSPEDRSLAESQKFCAIATENPLGTMGTPVKIDVNGQPVFLCCSGCKSKALGSPEETLASVAKLKAENSDSK